MDFGHVYQTLARLDAGDEEKILLTSRDKRSLLVVSFADVKRCLEEAFAEIFGQASAAGAPGSASGPRGGAGNLAGTGNRQNPNGGGPGGEDDGAVLPGGRGGMGMGMVQGGAGAGVLVAPIHGTVPMHGGMVGTDGGPMVAGLPPGGVRGHAHGHGSGGMPMVGGVGRHPHVHAQQLDAAVHLPHGMAMHMGMIGHHPGPPPHGAAMPPYSS